MEETLFTILVMDVHIFMMVFLGWVVLIARKMWIQLFWAWKMKKGQIYLAFTPTLPMANFALISQWLKGINCK
tara:strand:- start:293 stop:511 length:219 start_codon:yes stop_codon:yes gene_type:complete